MEEEIKAWEENYKKGRYNKWPYDIVISLIMRYYGGEKREKIKILDLGCGGGNNTYFLSKEGFQTYAVDGSPTSLQITKERLSKSNLSAHFQLANFKDLPYNEDFFDCVIDRASVYCNKWKDILKIFENIYRVIKKGGKYIGFLPNINHTGRIHGVEFEKNTYTDFKRGTFSHSDFAHFFTKEELFEALKNFEIVDILEHFISSILNEEESIYSMSEYIIVAKK